MRGALALVVLPLALLAGACSPPEPPPPPESASTKVPRTPAEPLRSRSERASLRGVELSVASWERSGRGLRLEVRIENRGAGIGLASSPPTAGTYLSDKDGGRAPLAEDGVSLDTLAREGLHPGEVLAGSLLFTEPSGGQPWTLVVPPFAPLELPELAVPGLREPLALGLPPAETRRDGSQRSRRQKATSGGDGLAAEIQLLLDRQADALVRRDETAYLETVHPERRRLEREHFQSSRQIPFSGVRLALPPEVLALPGGSHFETPVEMAFRIDEQPADNPFVYRPIYRFALLDGRWFMNGMREDPRRPLFWRQGSLALHRTHHFLIYVWPRPAHDVLEVARDAEAAYMTILQRGLPLASRYVAHLVTDEGLFGRVVGSPLAVGAARTRQVIGEDGASRVDSRAFFLNGPLLAPYRIDRPDAEERRVTIAHELVHLALSPWTRRQTPAWLVEGAAVYYSDGLDYDSNRVLVRSGLEELSLPSLTAASSLTGRQGEDHGARAAFEYLYAGNLVEYLVRYFGNDRLLAFYGSYTRAEARIPTAGAQPAAALELTEKGLAEHFRLSLATLDRQVKESMRLRYR